jgi:ABC-type Na+ efflux pump permease subunit
VKTSTANAERLPVLFYLFALTLGAGCGLLHVLVESMDEPDPLLSALAVTCAAMLLGVLRPARPWRWVLLVGAPVPLALVIASMMNPTLHFTRAKIAGSILVVLPGCAGAFGGSILRRRASEIFFEEKPSPNAREDKPGPNFKA